MFFKRKKKIKRNKIGLGRIDGLSAIKKSTRREGFSVYEIDSFVDLSQKDGFFYKTLEFFSEGIFCAVVDFFNKPAFDKRHPILGPKKKDRSMAFQVLLTAFLFIVAASLSTITVRAAFSGYQEPPEVLSEPVVTVDSGKAKISWETARESTSYVYYGTSSENLNLNKGSQDFKKNHTIVLDELMPSTTYFYRVQSYDMERKYDIALSLSDIYIFKTNDSNAIYSVSYGDITADSAMIKWRTIAEAKTEIQYGETEEYGLSVNIDEYATDHTYKITGLKSGRIYHFRIKSIDANNEKSLSRDYEFFTTALPQILDVDIHSDPKDSSSSIIVVWKTSIATDSYVSYEIDKHISTESYDELTEDHEITLYGLQSDAEYGITISGKDQFGNIVTSQLYKARTEVNAEAPKITDVSVQSNSLGIGEDAVAQVLISWKTNTPSTSEVQYSEIDSDTLNGKVDSGGDLTTNHLVLIPTLDLSHVYKFRPVSRDEFDNITYGEERIVVTEDYQPTVLEVIANMINRIFGE